MYMNSYGDDQDGVDTKVQNGVNEDGDSAGVHVSELDDPCSCR